MAGKHKREPEWWVDYYWVLFLAAFVAVGLFIAFG